MALPDEQIVYTLSIEDIRNVVEQEGLRELSDEEIREIEDKPGDRNRLVRMYPVDHTARRAENFGQPRMINR